MENIAPPNQQNDNKTPFNCEYQIKQGKFGWFQYTKTKTTLNLNIVDDNHFRNMKDIISLIK